MCDNDWLWNGYGMVLENSEVYFMVDMVGIFINMIEMFLKNLKVRFLFGLYDFWWRYVWEYFLIIVCVIYNLDWYFVKLICEKKDEKEIFCY